MASKIRIGIVDDHPLLRQGVASTLARVRGFEVVEQGGCAEDAQAIAERQQPDVLLMDVNMPGDTFAAVRAIAEAQPQVRILMLTVSESEDDVYAALESGAHGYVLKGVSGPELVQAVRNVAEGEQFITPQIADRLLNSLSRAAEDGARQVELTPREEEVIREVAQGLTNREVAEKFGLSEKTVKHHMGSVMAKLHARNRVEAVTAVRQHWANQRAASVGGLIAGSDAADGDERER
ncbi:response regulator transcription factor [Pseudomonas sp. UL073]|uniref:Response regulator transcription factor n=1 Tax=Zestomonas insulae TaxID=2809017 RepID=A0ABS2IFL3_9GAMM|nr:response regulator transcription factor [Pseudomonas insulae]MBM7060618.1 response regulator transcription factor [Pseudomonas insulae]